MFGVPSGKLLGFFVSHRGIEANPDKIRAIEQIQAPKSVKNVRRLTRCVAALSRFISKSVEHALPFFEIWKKVGLSADLEKEDQGSKDNPKTTAKKKVVQRPVYFVSSLL